MEINNLIQSFSGEGSSMPSQEKFSNERWQQEFERMNAEALAKARVVADSPVTSALEMSHKSDLPGKAEATWSDVLFRAQLSEKAEPVEKYGSIQSVQEKNGVLTENVVFQMTHDSPATVRTVMEYANEAITTGRAGRPMVEEKVRAILLSVPQHPALWDKENIHCELTKEGLVVWLRNASIDKNSARELGIKLSQELEFNGVRPIRIYLNGSISYSNRIDSSSTNGSINGGVK